jgi:hypothetical protein
MPIDAKKSGFVDGLFGRECKAPQSWQDGSKYLVGYLQGRESRKKYNINLTIKEERQCK